MPIYLRPEDRRPPPEPLVTDDRRAVVIGTALWALLAVLALLMRDRLAEAGDGWWLWSALCGFVLGFVGLWHLHRRARSGRR